MQTKRPIKNYANTQNSKRFKFHCFFICRRRANEQTYGKSDWKHQIIKKIYILYYVWGVFTYSRSLDNDFFVIMDPNTLNVYMKAFLDRKQPIGLKKQARNI